MKRTKSKKRIFPKIFPRKIDWLDLILIKLSTICATIFILTISKQINSFIFKFHWAWFLALAAIFSFRPLVKSEYVKEE
jgi:hypothetical protein